MSTADAAKTGANTLYLIDGSSYLYRAFHALPPLTSADGRPTGAVYGVVNMLNKFLQEEQPSHIAVLFDARGKTFRDELYAEYKAQRPSMPDDLAAQIEPLHETVRALGLPIIQMSGVEADDVIGTLCEEARKAGWRTVVSTIDKDMAQLVRDDVTLVNTMFDTRLDRDGVMAKFGVQPEQIVDYLALVGDTSDNIPGVPGVGQKSAAALLSTFETLDGIYDNLERLADAKVRGAKRIGEKLTEHRDDALLSRELATIRCDLTLEVALSELKRKVPDVSALRQLYTSLEFGTLLRQLPHDAPGTSTATSASVPASPDEGSGKGRHLTVVRTVDELTALMSRLTGAEQLAFEVYSVRPDTPGSPVVAIAMAWAQGQEIAYIAAGHRYPGAPYQVPYAELSKALDTWLAQARPKLVVHDGKRIVHAASALGLDVSRYIADDLMLASYVLNSTTGRHTLDELALKYASAGLDDYVAIAGKGAKQLGFDELEIERAADWSAPRMALMLPLEQTLRAQLAEAPALIELYEQVELPLAEVLRRMESRGVRIDVARLREQGEEIARQLATLEADAYEEAGEKFNLGSPKQLQEILFGKLGLPVSRKTPGGQPSTAEDVLEELSQNFRLPRLILEHRALSKLKSTYIDSLPRVADPATGRVHTTYHQAVAATGRLSSADPNLQNIPVRRPEGRRIRRAFVPQDGWRLISADYSQIELRIMAHLSGDESLVSAFAEDRDIHQATAAEVFGVGSPEDVTADQRRSAKAINFGLIYGMSPFGLARQLGIEQSAAKAYVDTYFERYPGVRRFMDDTRELAREQGYVETVFGRRLYLPEIRSRNYQRRQYAERSAINAPMQGTAADIIKRAMLAVEDWLSSDHGDSARLTMQVHDELVVEAQGDVVDAVSEGLVERMAGAATLAVPLRVETGTGDSWEEAH